MLSAAARNMSWSLLAGIRGLGSEILKFKEALNKEAFKAFNFFVRLFFLLEEINVYQIKSKILNM